MVTTIVTAVFPIFFARVAAAGLEPAEATRRFTLTSTLCMLVAALLSPTLGAVADFSAAKKKFLAVFLAIGASACVAMFWIERGDWLFAAILFALANVGATSSFVFYDSLLPHVAKGEDLDRVSTAGYALGYLGGGILLALNLAWIQKPEWFGLPHGEGLTDAEQSLPARLAFVAVAVWWVGFSIPLFRRVPEPPRTLELDERPDQSALRVAFQRLGETFRELKRYKQALLLLIAFLAYNDGIGTIIRMAAIYGEEVGIAQGHLIGAILLVQLVGIPCSFAFGALAGRIGAKRAILLSIGVYFVISLLAWRMDSAAEFYVLALLVGVVQGGSQALSRSLFASLIPKHKSGEFFGFFSVLEKFAGILGPGLFAVAQTVTGSSRHAILSVVGFFVVGGWLLLRVDVEAGQRAAREAESDATGA
ncbi:MAG: MFS transporter [Planctomycetes bacterium]|nr:MFS transporter [Planctomycetota bacterium]